MYNAKYVVMLGEWKMRRTKIIATIGPATSTQKTLKELVLAGANVIRINCSHGSLQENQKKIDLIKSVRKELNVPLSVMLDTRGPEIRVGNFEKSKVELKKGSLFAFYKFETMGSEHGVSLNEPKILDNLKLGSKILACNGLITFKVVEILKDRVVCKVKNSGTLSNHKSLFLPNIEYNVPYLNDADKKDIIWAIKNKVEYVAGSFVNHKEDVLALKDFIKSHKGNMEIISKIESKIGFKNLDEIIAESDGIMVARGDLGVEIPHEKLPELQKIIIKKSQECGKIVITATEMLESMVSSPRPTRAETSDVANAVYDGTSAIMLSGETAVGKYPTTAVSTMNKIAQETEKSIHYKKRYLSKEFSSSSITDVLSNAVVHISFMLKDIKATAVYTDSGHTAKMISRFKPTCPIYAFTPNELTYNRLSLAWGITPILCSPCKTADELIETINKTLKSKKLAKTNDMILIGTGTRKPSGTDMIKIHFIK